MAQIKSRETAPRDGLFGNDDSETKAPDFKAHQLEYSRRGFHEGEASSGMEKGEERRKGKEIRNQIVLVA